MKTKTNLVVCLLFLTGIFSCANLYARVTVGAGTIPAATLDVTITDEVKNDVTTPVGVIAPRLTGRQIQDKTNANVYTVAQHGTIVYALDFLPAAQRSPKTKNISTAGYYFYDANESNGVDTGLWKTLGGDATWFYMPSFPIDLSASGPFTINLYEEYVKQFANVPVRNLAAAATPSFKNVFINASEINYFITGYDDEVFDGLTISDAGILTGTIEASTVTDKTYINIVFSAR